MGVRDYEREDMEKVEESRRRAKDAGAPPMQPTWAPTDSAFLQRTRNTTAYGRVTPLCAR